MAHAHDMKTPHGLRADLLASVHAHADRERWWEKKKITIEKGERGNEHMLQCGC